MPAAARSAWVRAASSTAGPDGENVPDEIMELWAQRMLGESNEAARQEPGRLRQLHGPDGGVADHRQQQMEDRAARNPYAAARVEAANQMWDAQRGRDVRPPAEWDRMQWTPTARGAGIKPAGGCRRRTARGRASRSASADADVLAVAVRRGGRAQDRTASSGTWTRATPRCRWWTGSGINRTDGGAGRGRGGAARAGAAAGDRPAELSEQLAGIAATGFRSASRMRRAPFR